MVRRFFGILIRRRLGFISWAAFSFYPPQNLTKILGAFNIGNMSKPDPKDGRLRFLPIRLGEFSATPQAEISDRVQLFRVGTFRIDADTSVELTAQHFLSMKENFEKKVRGVDIAIDFAHQNDLEAAGWIQELFLNETQTELWARVLWTKSGKEKLVAREYRYLSGEFQFSYRSNETGQDYGPVLLGAGLTNRPVIKDMAPVIELSEEKKPTKLDVNSKPSDSNQYPKGDCKMDEKDKMIAALKAEIEELKKAKGSSDVEMGDMKKKLEEYAVNEKKALEEKKLAEKKSTFDKMLSEGRAVEAQREPFMKDDAVKFMELAQPVNLSASKGHGGEPNKTEQAPKDSFEAQDKIMKLAEDKVTTLKVPLGEAIQKVLIENPELRKKYRDE